MQIKVSNLKPGDLIPANDTPAASHGLMLPRLAVLRVVPVAQRGKLGILVAHLDGSGTTSLQEWSPDGIVDIDRAEEMTRAQKNADLLLGAVKGAAAIVKGSPADWGIRFEKDWLPAAKNLINRIEPPPPKAPTLAEALDALATLEAGAQAVMAGTWAACDMQAERDKARELLDRAHAAGVL